MQIVLTIIALLIVLGVVVFVHELGHFLAARWAGVRVDTFSIGFGPAIFKWHDKRGTLWKLACLPLGGYVSIYGQEDMFNRKKYTELSQEKKTRTLFVCSCMEAIYNYCCGGYDEFFTGVADIYIVVYVSATFGWEFSIACNWSGNSRKCRI